MIHWMIHGLMVVLLLYFSIDKLTSCWDRRIYQILYRINYRRKGWILFIDLDGLKKINDEMGHKEGDKILKRTGRTIMKASFFRGFRYGGDEFTVLSFSRDKRKIEEILKRIKEELKEEVRFSYGIGKTESEADIRMYENKSRGY